MRLGINIDHVATLRNARGVDYPCVRHAAKVCADAGADGLTIHLREDRRHIKDADVYALKDCALPMNLELAVTDEMLAIACDVRPAWVCLVPEKREELTTEGGLDVINHATLGTAIDKLKAHGIGVSIFIDPDFRQIAKAMALGADAIELHTGAYAHAHAAGDGAQELLRIEAATAFALAKHPNFIVNAGHGLTLDNTAPIAKIVGIHELNIGHAIISDAIFVGLYQAIKNMRAVIDNAVGKP